MEDNNNNGWISLYRKFTNWRWYKDVNVKAVFTHLLLIANHCDGIWKNKTILRGQAVTSREHLADDLGLSIQQIRTCLTKLESTNEIKIQTTNKYSLITIVNYDKYQKNIVDEQSTSKSTESSTDKITDKTTSKSTSKIKAESVGNSEVEETKENKSTNKTTNKSTSKITDNSTDKVTTNNNNIITNNNNILLNYTKLNLLFNYLSYKENHFENLTNADRNIIVHHLKRLDLYFDNIQLIDVVPKEKILETKIYYWVITSIWISEYKMYFENLKRNNFLFRFLKTKKYVPITSESSEKDLKHFVSYFMKCLMEDMKND